MKKGLGHLKHPVSTSEVNQSLSKAIDKTRARKRRYRSLKDYGTVKKDKHLKE